MSFVDLLRQFHTAVRASLSASDDEEFRRVANDVVYRQRSAEDIVALVRKHSSLLSDEDRPRLMCVAARGVAHTAHQVYRTKIVELQDVLNRLRRDCDVVERVLRHVRAEGANVFSVVPPQE